MQSTLERLKVARELRDVVIDQEAGAQNAERRLVMQRRADALRALLLGRRKAGELSDLDIFDYSNSGRALLAHMSGLEEAWHATKAGTPEGNAATHALQDAGPYARIVASYLTEAARSAGDSEAALTYLGDLGRVAVNADHQVSTEFQKRHFKAMHDVGRPEVDAFVRELSAMNERVKVADQALHSANDQHAREFGEQLSTLRELKEAAYESWDLLTEGKITREEAQQRREAYSDAETALRKAHLAKWEPIMDSFREVRDLQRTKHRELAASFIGGLLEQSSVSVEQAQRWAADQTITSAASARLKKMGYPIANVRRDMAEFYRLTGGRLSRVTITSKGQRRANAENIHGHADSTINLGKYFGKRTLWHEMAHHLEADPLVLAASRGFLVSRRKSETPESMRKLTGSKFYEAKEKAWTDGWFDHYVGKVYPDATEVMSMGVESFSDSTTFAERASKDPEMFGMLVGFMRSAPAPLFGAVKKVLDQKAWAQGEAASMSAKDREQAIAVIAAGVALTQDPDIARRRPGWIDKASGVYLGTLAGSTAASPHGIDIYACKAIRDPSTKRKKSGYAILAAEERDPDRYPGLFRTQWIPCFGDEAEAIALARVWSRTGEASYLSKAEDAQRYAEFFAP